MTEGVEESRRKRMPSCNGTDRAAARRGYPARKGADFRRVSAEPKNLDASTGGDVRRRKLNRPTGKGNESSPCQAKPGSDVPCRSGDNPLWWRLEPDDGQLSRPVLRGLGFGNGAWLPDVRPESPMLHQTSALVT